MERINPVLRQNTLINYWKNKARKERKRKSEEIKAKEIRKTRKN
jgi:hypothetical protein